MSLRRLPLALCLAALVPALAGCGSGPEGGSVTLAEGGGKVTFKGAPLAGATVTFVPEKGPAAFGTTNLEGTFKLSSGNTSGVAIGPCKVGILAAEAGKRAEGSATVDMTPPKNEEEAKKRMEAMALANKMQSGGTAATATGAKSLINPKYADPEKSGLTATVVSDASKNQFTFDVTE